MRHRRLGRTLATAARPGDLICLWGELGAGKTHLAKAFGAGLGVTDTITSPSFILMAEYVGRLPLFHLDLFRLASAADALAGGLIDDRQALGVTLVEWPDRLADALPLERLDVRDRRRRRRAALDRRPGRHAGAPPLPRGDRMSHDGRRRAILAIDTATTRVVIASGSPDGEIDGLTTWTAGYRHGETLLPSIARFLGEQNLRRSRLTGIVVGTGPGAFTGLRVGIATAKGLAHGLGLPIAGISTAEAMLLAAVRPTTAGRAERAGGPGDPAARSCCCRPGRRTGCWSVAARRARLLPGGTEPDLAPGEWLVAVDLEGRAPDDAVALGETRPTGPGPRPGPDGRAAAAQRRWRRPRRAGPRVRHVAARGRGASAGRWHGRATPAEAAHRADARRRPAGRPRDRAGELRLALAGRRLSLRARDEPARPVPRRARRGRDRRPTPGCG